MAHDAVRRGAVRAAWLAFGWFWGTWSALIPAVKRATGVDDETLGLLLLAVPLAAMPAMIVSGRAYDRRGGSVLIGGFLTMGALAPVLGATSDGLVLAGCLAVLGAASGMVDVALNSATVATPSRPGRDFVQSAQAMFPVAGVAASAVVAAARELGVPAWAMLGSATLFLGAAAVWLGVSGIAAAPARKAVDGEAPALTGTTLVLLGATLAAALLVENAIQQWSSNRLEFELGAAPGVASLAPGVFALCMFGARLHAQRRARITALVPTLRTAAIVSGCGLVIAAWAPSPLLALAGFALAGLGLAPAAPALFASAGRSVPEELRGRAISLVSTIGYSGYFIGPVAVGLVSSGGGLSAGFTVVAVIAMSLAVPTQWLRDRVARTAP
ncbi:MFS transporter [Streptomyces cyaneochromogenes]|uniref:MFS transporter n=1 Tax=Streptomyces cyaneochromogenes TaxID=2496836 RepID=A0A3S9LZP3_9ACTN|nr:MFS transporter [Streptomyces cyaneochromogenes]AZQ32379.1 MFS transporter [Streptomyces cyaneochromogenes]